MDTKIVHLPGGTITSPDGFKAGAISAHIKTNNKLDLAILYSDRICTAAGVFTTNQVKAPAVILSQKQINRGIAQAVVVNAGCANACLGEQGLKDAHEIIEMTAKKLSLPFENVLIASTGVIGIPLPMDNIRNVINKIELSRQGGHDMASAIITTDTRIKEIAVSLDIAQHRITIGGIAKGAGMLCPNMATMLCFLTTDAAIEKGCLQKALKNVADDTYNMLNVDGDTSTNDTVICLANGYSGNKAIQTGTPEAELFQLALSEVCRFLTRELARDAEGATRLIEVTVEKARTLTDARLAAHTIVGSLLVKSAVHGAEPNWGRIFAALGRAKITMFPAKVDIYMADICVLHDGNPIHFNHDDLIAKLHNKEIDIKVSLNIGSHTATAWGCDLSQEYVIINSNMIT